jgi:cell division protein FtsW
MSETLRLPWSEDERGRREVAPSVFRPRRKRLTGTLRSHASRPEPRRTEHGARAASVSRGRAPSVSRSAALAALPAAIPSTARRLGGHASREARDRVPGRVVHGPQRERHEPDYLLLVAAVALSAVGILMVYSSRGVDAARDGSIFDAVTTQLGWGLLGGLALIMAMRLDYRYWRMFSVLGMVLAVGLLVLVLMPAIPPLIQPIEANGATRWLRIGGLPAFHPAEFAKLALVVYLAHWLATRGTEVSSLRRGLLPFLVVVGLLAGLVVLEPDLGTTGVLVLTGFTVFFVAGGSIWQLLLMVPLGMAGVAALLVMNPYQMARWTTFLDPFSVASSDGYQTVHGLYALALGGVFGQGLGQSRQPSGLALPAAENDFIFAVVGQEFGLIGGLLVIALFLLLTWRGIRIAMRAPDTFGSLLATGITAWLAFQAFINIGVVVQLLPLTGITLPFLSDGGTSLVVALTAVGILLSISRESVPQGTTDHEDPHRGRGHRRPHLPRPGRRHPAGELAA